MFWKSRLPSTVSGYSRAGVLLLVDRVAAAVAACPCCVLSAAPVATRGAVSEILVLSTSYSQNGLESESRSCMAVIDCCKALGVNHSFGKQRCRKGTQELKWAKRFTQLGISWPQRICVSAPEKWLQLLFIRWYRSPRNWFPSSSTIRRTSSSVKSVQPICILCRNRNWSPSSSWSRGDISNTPVNGNGWPPYANSVPNTSTPEWNTPSPIEVVYSLIQYISYTLSMTGSRLPIAVGSSSSLPLSFGTPRQLGKGRLQGSPFENITTSSRCTNQADSGGSGRQRTVAGILVIQQQDVRPTCALQFAGFLIWLKNVRAKMWKQARNRMMDDRGRTLDGQILNLALPKTCTGRVCFMWYSASDLARGNEFQTEWTFEGQKEISVDDDSTSSVRLNDGGLDREGCKG